MDAAVVNISTPEDCALLARVLADVWGFDEPSAVVPSDLLRALAHSGAYVAGVVIDGQLIGGGFAWPTQIDGERRLHSHVIGFLEDFRALGLGARIKHHQRDFARERGMAAIQWTYDPLHAGNARFNLAKLGARVLSFHDNLYGETQDVFGAGLGSDRFLVRWGVNDEPPEPDAVHREWMLRVGVNGEPLIVETEARRLRAEIPTDIVHLRKADKSLAIAWRDAFARTVGRDVSHGATVVGLSDGAYLIDR